MKQPLGITFNVTPGQEATGVYESEDGIEVFETDKPYLLSDGQSLAPPLPVKVVDGPTFLDSMGRLQSAIPVSGIGPTPPDYGTDFVFVMRTTEPGETVTIPCQNNGTFNADVDWGDGSTSSVTAWNDANLTHEYAVAGDHVIRVSGQFPNIYFNNGGDKDKLIKVLQLGHVGLIRLDGAFRGCSNLESFKAGPCDTSLVARMDFMLYACTSLVAPPDFDGFSTEACTLMHGFMDSCSAMTSPPDFASFNCDNVTNQAGMCRNWNSVTSWPDFSPLASPVVSNLNSFVRGGTLTDIGIDAGLHLLDITSVTNIAEFAAGSSLTTEAYDAILIAWAAQEPPSGLSVNFGNSIFTPGGAAEAAYFELIDDYNWLITDGAFGPNTWTLATKTTSGASTWNPTTEVAHIISDGAYTVVQALGAFAGATGQPHVMMFEVFDYVSGQIIVGDSAGDDYTVPPGNGFYEYFWSPNATTAQIKRAGVCNLKVRNIRTLRVL